MKITHRVPTSQFAFIEIEFDMNEYTDEDDATKTIVKYHKKLLDAWEVMKEEKADEELAQKDS